MSTIYHLLVIILLVNSQLISQGVKTRWVDDISTDSKLDDPDFKICNQEDQIIQYFNNGQGMEYIGGKYKLDSFFYSNYKFVLNSKESGLIRIRFVVNCKGGTGRFRMIASDNQYKEKVFDPAISQQLISISKKLDGWIPKQWKNTNVDYYQYLIFKIENGKLVQILP
ncbi:MAG: hypothetical protein IPH93_07410 [Saprospiraceae bacterium]|nr:hypothetical protein [Saprospiraceae bacterium]MBK7811106.1 hypothetical protein [Saprospiraceae bacterium]MBK9630702.1 hypothetical protein [Saprospiraceae bacterium]